MKRFTRLSAIEKVMVYIFVTGLIFSCVGLIVINNITEPQLMTIEEYIAHTNQSEQEVDNKLLEEEKTNTNNAAEMSVEANTKANLENDTTAENLGYTSNSNEAEDGKININTATVEQLQQLKGIGPSKAKAIIEERELGGPFKSIEDIKRVKGIGDKTFETIKESLVN